MFNYQRSQKGMSRIILAAIVIIIAGFIGCSKSGGKNNGLMLLLMGKSQVAKPVFSPLGGTFDAGMSVTITCPTAGASIYYTTNGDDPTSSSAPYLAPVPVTGNHTVMTIKAIAILEDMKDSEIASTAYTINFAHVSSPQFSLVAGTYDHDVNVTITSSTVGADIYYTTNGDNPTSSSTPYIGAISVSGDNADTVIKAIAIKSGMEDSTIESAEYKIEYVHVAEPTFTPAGGTYNHDVSVELSCTEVGSEIHYTTNGDEPTIASPVYSSGISVAGHGNVKTIKAIATKTGMAPSPVASATYTINYDRVSTPNFSLTGGTYDHDISVTITCATASVTIYYTIDGTPPDTSSSVYSSAIPVAGHNTSVQLRAYAVKGGMLDSTVASADYLIQWKTVETPVVSGYNYLFKSETVSISCATSGATIYYTTNGDPPTTSSAQYTSPITISGLGSSVTVKAIAVKTGMLDSLVGQKTFTVDQRDVYIVGYYGYLVGSELYQYAGYWKNNQNYIQVRDNGGYPAGSPQRIFVSGSNVYIAGANASIAWYWINGTMVGLTGKSANGLYVDGSTVYTAGYYNTSPSPIARYWIGTARYAITTAYKSMANAIALSDSDVYVAGWNQASSSDPQKACYWVNGSWNDLPVPAGATSSAVTDIAVSGSDVYFAGWYNNGSINCACYWLEGTRYDLETATDTTVTGLGVSGTDVYVSGSKSAAGYWLDSVWTALHYDRAVAISVIGSDVYVIESHHTNWTYGIHITKNGTVVREFTSDLDTPISMFVKE
jgi:hypothetical protein